MLLGVDNVLEGYPPNLFCQAQRFTLEGKRFNFAERRPLLKAILRWLLTVKTLLGGAISTGVESLTQL